MRNPRFQLPIALFIIGLILMAVGETFFTKQFERESLMGQQVSVLKMTNKKKAKSKRPDRGLMGLCVNERDCNIFCKNNFQVCKQYCAKDLKNPICQKPFTFEMTSPSSYRPLAAATLNEIDQIKMSATFSLKIIITILKKDWTTLPSRALVI